MDNLRSSERTMVKIANHTPTSILRNVYNNENHDERSPSRIAATSGVTSHRTEASSVRVKRSTNDCFPTAVVPPNYPLAISTKTPSSAPQSAPTKTSGDLGQQRYISFNGIQLRFSPAPGECANPVLTPFGSSSSLSRRSRSSIGSAGFGMLARKLEYQEFEAKPLQQERNHRGSWLGEHLDAECQVPSNSILTLHSLLDDSLNSDPRPRDDSQERRLKLLESRLQDIEMRLINAHTANKRDALVGDSASVAKSEVQKPNPEVNRLLKETRFSPPSNSQSTPKTSDFGIVSVAAPPMMGLDGTVFRVQPTPKSELKAQREIENLEKKLKHQEEVAEALRTQHYKQIEQLTRQLASNDDITQTLRSRIRELELENELWQNRFRLYNDVDVAKILRENERLRSRQRKRSSRDEKEDGVELQKKEQTEEENEKLRARYNELENKYRAAKDKYKETIKAYRTRRRQDHIELESMKVSMELQNTELSELRKRVDQVSSLEEPFAQIPSDTMTGSMTNSEFVGYNLDKCQGIADCLTNICTHIKRNEPLDPSDVLDYGPTSISGPKNHRGQNATGKAEKPIDETLDALATKMTTLHSMVVDLYGDDLANSVSCNVQ